LDDECKGPNAVHRAVQVAINDAARKRISLFQRGGRQDSSPGDLEMLPLPRRGGGARNPVGEFVFPIPRRPMRSTTPVVYPLGRETFACHAISVWNTFKVLRSATTLHAAWAAARVIGRSVPT
ncbi:Hypothetical protein FKW44_009039, partial [Caligus rogercresseyi]